MPTGVPAGRYAQAALTSLGVWKNVEPRVVRADNVRAALTFVERKEAAAGIVYATDAALTDKVEVAGAFPASSSRVVGYNEQGTFVVLTANPDLLHVQAINEEGAAIDSFDVRYYDRKGAPSRVEVWTVPGADHTGGLATAPDAWTSRVVEFLTRTLRPAG